MKPAHQRVSVRFRGQVREEAGAEPVGFDEVWHLVKPNGQDGWRLAGIQQMPCNPADSARISTRAAPTSSGWVA